MKRAGKCANKRKYPYKSLTIDMAHWKYINENIHLGVYECPTCLDFHLTSKYCNLKHLHKDWEKVRNTWTGSREEIKKKRELQRRRLKKKLAVKTQPNPESNTSKRKAYKKVVLPLSEQRRILAKLDNKKLSTRKSFWSRLRGIIKVNRI